MQEHQNPNIAQLVERPTVESCRYRAVPGSNPCVRMFFIIYNITKVIKLIDLRDKIIIN